MPQEQTKVVIVGAGLVGSMAAIYMARLGYEVVVYEKRPDIRGEKAGKGRSINLALSKRGIMALYGIDLDAKVLQAAIPMKGRMIHSLDGNSTTFIPYGDFGEVINSVDRRGLNEILLDAAQKYSNVTLKFDQELLSMDAAKGTLTFQGTMQNKKITKEQADFILGCDGAYSVVRRELLKSTRIDFSQEYIQHGYKEFCIPAEDESGKWKMPTNYLHIWPRHKFMLIALPNPDGTFTATLFYPHDLFAKINSEEDIKKLFQDNFTDAIELIGEERLIKEFNDNPTGSLVTMKCSQYHYEDKVLLLGDAAHAMVPFYGQGMNAGFEDLVVLVDILSKEKDRKSAFLEYSKVRKPDAHAICNLALYNYWEMSSAVTSWNFRIRRSVYGYLHYLMPSWLVPLYSMVAFTTIPYAQVVRRHARQERLLNLVFGSIGISLMGGLLALLLYSKKSLSSN